MKSGWADHDPEIKPLESSKFTPARLEALGKAFPGERPGHSGRPAEGAQQSLRLHFAGHHVRLLHRSGFRLRGRRRAGPVPVDPDSPEAAAGKTHTPELFVAPRADNSTEDFFTSAHYGEYGLARVPVSRRCRR